MGLTFNGAFKLVNNLTLTPGIELNFINYGRITEIVTENLNYNRITEAVISTDNFGRITEPVI